jgi:O-6-methylguanine DNA methyltransferase
MKTQSVKLPILTSDGQFVAHYSENGLAELDFPSVGRAPVGSKSNEDRSSRAVSRRRRGNESQISSASSASVRDSSRRLLQTKILRWHRATVAALKNILAGRSPGKFPPLDLSNGTMFQQKVWNALQKIARGRTKSYGEIARAVGKPRAVRAVGGACGANPIPVLIPCHRVVAANKKLGGFSGGLNWKRDLLKREGVSL